MKSKSKIPHWRTATTISLTESEYLLIEKIRQTEKFSNRTQVIRFVLNFYNEFASEIYNKSSQNEK